MVLSPSQEANSGLVGDQTTRSTVPPWLVRVYNKCRVSVDQSWICPARSPEAISRPSLEKARQRTGALWPIYVAWSRPVRASHRWIAPSPAVEAIRESDEQASAERGCVWP